MRLKESFDRLIQMVNSVLIGMYGQQRTVVEKCRNSDGARSYAFYWFTVLLQQR